MTQPSPFPWTLHHKHNGLCAITSGQDILVADDVRPADAELLLARMKRAEELEAFKAKIMSAITFDDENDIHCIYAPTIMEAFGELSDLGEMAEEAIKNAMQPKPLPE